MLSSRVKLALAIFNRKPRGLSSAAKAGLGLAGLAGAGAAAHLGFDQYHRAAEAAKHLRNIAETARVPKSIANEVPNILESSISQTAPDSVQEVAKVINKIDHPNDLRTVYPSPIDVTLLDNSTQGDLAKLTNAYLKNLRQSSLAEDSIQNITNMGRASFLKDIVKDVESQPNLSSADKQYLEDLKDNIYSEEMEVFKRKVNPFEWSNTKGDYDANKRSYLFGTDRNSVYGYDIKAPRRFN